MRHIIFIMLLIPSIGSSQEIDDLLQSKQFVIEANKMTDGEGSSNITSRKLCFILIDATKVIVQWIANCDNNGLGGITMNGKIDDYSISSSNINQETQHLVKIKCEMDDGRVQTEINVEIYNKSHAEATLTNQTSSIFIPGLIKLQGKLVPLNESKVIIGSD